MSGSLGSAAGDNDHPALTGGTGTGVGVLRRKDLTAEVRGMDGVRIRHPAQLLAVQQGQPHVRGFEVAGDQISYSPAHIGQARGVGQIFRSPQHQFGAVQRHTCLSRVLHMAVREEYIRPTLMTIGWQPSAQR